VVNSIRNYHEHLSEYGTHWSFFFSMACVAILATLVESTVLAMAECRTRPGRRQDSNNSSNNSGRSNSNSAGSSSQRSLYLSAALYAFAGLATAAVYQWLLFRPVPLSLAKHISAATINPANGMPVDSMGGLWTMERYVMRYERSPLSFVDQNREGIFGVCGFFALYLVGVGGGRMLLDPTRRSVRQWRDFAVALAAFCAVAWGLYWGCASYVTPVSRRLVNFSYVLWVMALSASMLLALVATDLCTYIYRTVDVPAVDANSSMRPATTAEDYKARELRSERLRRNGHFDSVKPETRAMVAGATAAAVTPDAQPSLLGRYLRRCFLKPEPCPDIINDGGSILMYAVNVNFLPFFMIANWVMGVVNMVTRTLDTPDAPAFVWLLGYLFVCACIAMTLYHKSIVLKVW
jgi:hypothetical protein